MNTQKITTLLIIILAALLLSADFPAKNQSLYGVWRMISGKNNGINNPPIRLDRTWEFKKDNTFEGKIFLPNGIRPYNQGIFMLVDDTTMVTIHTDLNTNKMSPFAYKYNFHINKDTLHFHGYYLSPSRENRKMLTPVHIDEVWVKILPE